MKSIYFQNFVIVLFIISVTFSALLAHITIPLVAILGGFVSSFIICRLTFKKWFKGEVEFQIPSWKKYIISAFVALVGSQMGWVALLI